MANLRKAEIYSVPMSGPDDVSGIERLFDDGIVDPAHVVAVISQTEGDGYARGFAAQSLKLVLGARLNLSAGEVFQRIPLMMIGGTAGIMSPHHTVFVNMPATGTQVRSPEKRMVIGVSSTRALMPEEYGRKIQAELVADAVRTAMADAGIDDASDVVCVELKVPQMTPARMNDALVRGENVANDNPLVASGMSRGASALGAAVALGEIDADSVTDAAIGKNLELYSGRASASSGGEQVGCRVVVIGNVAGSPSELVAGNSVMENQLDLPGAWRAFQAAGLSISNGVLDDADKPRFVTAFVNAGANYAPDVGGRRHTMNSDLLAAWAGHQAKAVIHAIVSAIVGDTLILANAGAEHQGRPGANLVCVIARA